MTNRDFRDLLAALSAHSVLCGNSGNVQLLGNEAVLRAALVELEAKARKVTIDDIGW